MLDLLNKRNCPVCGGAMECKNSDYENLFHGEEPFLILTWYCTNCGAEYNTRLVLTQTGYEVCAIQAHTNVENDFLDDKFLLKHF